MPRAERVIRDIVESVGPVPPVDSRVGESERMPGGLLCVRLNAGEGGTGQARSADPAEGERVRGAVRLQRGLSDQDPVLGSASAETSGITRMGLPAGRAVRQCSREALRHHARLVGRAG